MSDLVTVYSVFESAEQAQKICRQLLEEKLIACANIIPGQSLFRWDDGIEEVKECFALMKTRETFSDKVKSRLEEIHPYATPCIVVYRPASASEAYTSWVFDSVQ